MCGTPAPAAVTLPLAAAGSPLSRMPFPASFFSSLCPAFPAPIGAAGSSSAWRGTPHAVFRVFSPFILGFFPPLFLAGKGGKQPFLGAAEHLGCSRLSCSTSPSNTLLLARFGVVLLQISPFGPAPISKDGYTIVSNAFFISRMCHL